ncbi:sugar ABC transporter ATP-binding protein [Parasphaerochaeta coccoides]|uniref:Monosaccharide ABC transporter ATP-binding protein, CUT2 family n=1 Tax=Parasphaerochaeta coccoides (strain ATCC BAA-1237 / DSM 17374 / SPN1) TaxID=760011 RepID=F4GJS9_PARC1|nr:sugar ABC transporter ATP-binding protein [Parasphaerochaeta coccoides]AEC02826.1 monosaccharide ABC transporter ATP-binding protein, CUT2 family [Parasphaerochaeta coccoides DSM 17374]
MAEYIVEMKHITKKFPGVIALDDVSFGLKSGEVLALLGENGAGKSTLMKILSGVYLRDEGFISLFGENIGDLNPRLAQKHGVAMIHQELNMCSHLTVTENLFLGRELISGKGTLDNKAMRHQAQEVLARLNIDDITPDTIVGKLAVSKQQMVEIAKALLSDARVLIMDEPTSALTSKEITDLFSIIHKLRSEGRGIVYISHRLEELQHIVDRVIIMRDGKTITTRNFKDISMDEIISFMVGREITEKFPTVQSPIGKKIFEVKNLCAGRAVRDISFSLNQGEIVGIAGLMGAGRTETTRAIFGVDPKDSGSIFIDGAEVVITKPEDAISQGIVLVPEDRKKDGLCTKLSIKENIALPNLDILGSRFLGVINRKSERDMVDKAVENLSIKLTDIESNAANLSGGNQQKVVVGKWLARDSRVVMFDEPTRGIDVAAKVEIYHLMNQLKQQGIGVLFVSSEMQEIIGISDRILVMCDGKLTGELSSQEATQEKILELATHFEKKLT